MNKWEWSPGWHKRVESAVRAGLSKYEQESVSFEVYSEMNRDRQEIVVGIKYFVRVIGKNYHMVNAMLDDGLDKETIDYERVDRVLTFEETSTGRNYQYVLKTEQELIQHLRTIQGSLLPDDESKRKYESFFNYLKNRGFNRVDNVVTVFTKTHSGLYQYGKTYEMKIEMGSEDIRMTERLYIRQYDGVKSVELFGKEERITIDNITSDELIEIAADKIERFKRKGESIEHFTILQKEQEDTFYKTIDLI